MSSSNYQRVRDLFQRAVELDGDQRTKFVDNLEGESADVLAEVRRLLRHHVPEARLFEAEEPSEHKEVGTGALRSGTRLLDGTTAEFLGDSSTTRLERSSLSFGRRKRDAWPYVAVSVLLLTLLIVVGVWVHGAIQRSVSESLRRTMQALLDEQHSAIYTWMDAEQRLVETWTRAPKVVAAVTDLHQLATDHSDLNAKLRQAPAVQQLQSAVDEVTGLEGGYQYAVWNREGTLLADSSPMHADFLGNTTTEYGASLLSRVFQGETVLWLPTRAGFITADFELRGPVTKPGVALIAPVPGSDGRPIGAMLISSPVLQIRLEDLLTQARFGETGEAYAFVGDGYLLTECRFVDQLKATGLIEDLDDGFSAQVLRVADPGGNLLEGFSPKRDHRTWPLTRSVAAAVSGVNGADFEGYRDYRGVTVVGVWKWLPQYRFGILTEIDRDHALSPLSPLNRAFSIVVGTLLTVAVGAVSALLIVLRLRKNSAVGRIGAYTLNCLLGEGGFAHVYLASHALLKRPTAIKVLKRDQMNERNLVRFEREVQLASSLTHPNTIGIYDYGRAADGRFFYAMEYIKGLSLQELVELDGPQPPERVSWILLQICRSLREAHSLGLIHRDIKPQNVMLCKRGGEEDTVKVLDFGLARNLDPTDLSRVTETQLLIGTPLYIAPERILDPTCMDPSSDIYSLGILGYYLLTGREPFEAADSMDALAQTVNRQARRPSELSPVRIPEQLDDFILACHARATADRPASIDVAIEVLLKIKFPRPWNSTRAAEWWNRHRAGVNETRERDVHPHPDRTTRVLTDPRPGFRTPGSSQDQSAV